MLLWLLYQFFVTNAAALVVADATAVSTVPDVSDNSVFRSN